MKLFDEKFCDAILPNRKRTLFKKKQILYQVGDTERTLFFLLDGFVKAGTVTSDGHEVIYDVRKGGDLIGERRGAVLTELLRLSKQRPSQCRSMT